MWNTFPPQGAFHLSREWNSSVFLLSEPVLIFIIPLLTCCWSDGIYDALPLELFESYCLLIIMHIHKEKSAVRPHKVVKSMHVFYFFALPSQYIPAVFWMPQEYSLYLASEELLTVHWKTDWSNFWSGCQDKETLAGQIYVFCVFVALPKCLVVYLW